MNCRDVDLIITTWARAEVLDESRVECLAHTETCARCTARVAGERALLAGIQTVVVELAGEQAPTRVETALLLAFHEREKQASGWRVLRTAQMRGRARWMWATAAAAVLAIVSSIVVSRLEAPTANETHRPEDPSSGTSSLIAPVRATVPTANPDKNPADERREMRGRRSIRQPRPDVSEIATDFMPLLEGDDLASLDSSQLVRVELPGSALIAVGLPVDAEMADARVKADVLLGHDGLARAIRFVR
jgi:hypothetical protein